MEGFIDTIPGVDPTLLASACNLYNTSPDELTPLSGGNFNSVYEFCYDNKPAVLRLGVEDCPPEQTLAMLDWVSFLSKEGAPVSAPLASIRHHLLENLMLYGVRYNLIAFEKGEGTLAERLSAKEWTDGLFTSIGKAAGKLHAVSKKYKPSRPKFTRPQWYDGGTVRSAIGALSGSADPALQKLEILIQDLRALPVEPGDYGLIHDDLHFANFLVHPSGSVTIIDFDDCVYGWFAMDVAMALFDVLVLYHAASEDENKSFARRFMSAYLSGYRSENELSTFWLEQIPRLLKLKEICVYAPLIGHPESTQPGTWVGDFMPGRAERIAQDIPYVDIDFRSL